MQGHGFGPWRGKFYMLHGVGPHPLKKPQPLVTTWMDHESESESRSVMSDSLRPHEPYSPWNSPGQNTGACSLTLLQRIFPTQGLNPGLPHCRRILYQLSYQESPTDCQLQTGTCQEHCQWLNNSNKGICHLPLPLRRWNPALLQLLTLHSRWGSSGWSEALCAPGNLVEQVFR